MASKKNQRRIKEESKKNSKIRQISKGSDATYISDVFFLFKSLQTLATMSTKHCPVMIILLVIPQTLFSKDYEATVATIIPSSDKNPWQQCLQWWKFIQFPNFPFDRLRSSMQCNAGCVCICMNKGAFNLLVREGWLVDLTVWKFVKILVFLGRGGLTMPRFFCGFDIVNKSDQKWPISP